MKRPLFLLCMLFLFAARLVLHFSPPPENLYEIHGGKMLRVTGTVEKKERKGDSRLFCLKACGIAGADPKTRESQWGLICAVDGPEPPIGARVEVYGSIWIYPHATNPGEFDLYSYYLYQGYGARMNVESFRLLSDSYDGWREGLWQLRCECGKLYGSMLGEEDAAVAKAMVLGDRGELSPELKELYRINGISHILAISGLHISLIGMGLYRLLRKSSLPILPSALTALFVLVNYAILTGAGTSTVRALIMFALMAGADAERRSYDLPTALGISAASTVLSNPYLILTSSFWLSYGAVFGIAVFAPALRGELRASGKELHAVLSALLGSVAVTLFTLPMILAFYFEMPVFAVFLNLLVIPLMSVAMLSALLMLPLGFLYLPLGSLAGYPCHLVLSLYRFLCERIAELPFSTYTAGRPPEWKIILCYLIYIALITADLRLVKKLLEKCGRKAEGVTPVKLLLVKSAVCILCLFLLLGRSRPDFRLTMLDVGQGDGLCIETKEAVFMIDGGSSSKDQLYEYQLGPFLKYSGISRVDYWFVTHPDSDHLSGLLELLSDENCPIRIGTLVLPEAKGAAEDFVELIDAAGGKGCRILWNASGRSMESQGLCISCLHPAAGASYADVNAYSQVLKVEYADLSLMLTGDATTESEQEVLRRIRNGELKDPGEIDVLKLGHHGSSTSSSEEWLTYLRPRTALISCGKNNRYGHPHKEVMERLSALGCDVFRTDRDGAVIVTADEIHAFCRE
ncbi:MAG: DNA internalization-related competence protein ComEC/Rec2 [Lachnospiraceae bacterium]|nr:DNA internalization-related competence protein ComEC/Rec2 [Lachnospiraceae bacterium]